MVMWLSSSSTSSSLPSSLSQSPHHLHPRDNIAAAVNTSSSSSHPLSLQASGTGVYGLPPDLNRAGGNWRHTMLYLGCARALPHPGAWTLSAGGHQGMVLCCHGWVAIVAHSSDFYAILCHLDLGAPSSRHANADAACRWLPPLLFVAHCRPPLPHLLLPSLSHPHHPPPPRQTTSPKAWRQRGSSCSHRACRCILQSPQRCSRLPLAQRQRAAAVAGKGGLDAA